MNYIKILAGNYFIAEVGINHEGDLDSAMEHCREAYIAGADSVKFQWVNADRAYEIGTESYEIFKRAYFNIDQMKKIKLFCDELGIDFFATPGDMETLYELSQFSNKIVKISSGLSTHRFMIRESTRFFRTLIISTGTLKLEEIVNLENFVKQYTNNIIILKCTSEYPSSDENLNLDAITSLKEVLTSDIGYSCHSLDDLPAIIARTLGAGVIEKHFSLDPKREGFDHSISFNPSQTKALIEKLKRINIIKEWDGRLPSKKEITVKDKMHRYMVAKKEIPVGSIINLSDFYYMRLKKHHKDEFVSALISCEIEGKRLKQTCPMDSPLRLDYLDC